MPIIRKNFGLKVLAVVLAVIGWAYFRFATNPIVAAARFDQQVAVPITVVNLPNGYVAHFAEREAVVTIATNRGEAPVKPDEFKAVLDLSGRSAGVYNVPITLAAPNVVVQSLSPASVALSVEKIEQRAFQVVPHYTGNDAATVVVGNVRLLPGAVTVQGPSSVLAQVTAVHVNLEMPAAPKSLDVMVRPVAVNATGVEVAGLEVAPDLVRVQARFAAGSRPGSTK